MPSRTHLIVLAVVALVPLTGCRQDMHDQPKYEPLEVSDFFADGHASRPPIAGTVARGWLQDDDHLHRGLDANGKLAATLPMPLTRDLLEHGRERYDIFCSPCHARTGDGLGMIVLRGFKQPETFHQDRLRDVQIGYFFDVMTHGFGQMSSYASQVPVEDRWAIAAYVRVLQASRHTPAAALSSDDLAAIQNPGATTAPDHGSDHEEAAH